MREQKRRIIEIDDDNNENIGTLIGRALKTGQQTLIKRIYSARETIKQQRSTNDNEQLLAMFVHPAFVATEEGCKLLAYVFATLVDMKDAHATIKRVLPQASKTVCKNYGDVYYRTWKNIVDENQRIAFEDDCIQDLMYLCVMCKSLSVPKNLCYVMQSIAAHKMISDVDSMLARVVQPILWRNVEVPNAAVRCSALSLFFVLYPIRDPNLPHDERITLLRRQHDMIHSMLIDECANVRVCAINGVCRVLRSFWSTIDIGDIGKYLNCLSNSLAVDTSSVHVRLAVYTGFEVLLECQGAVEAMKKVLKKTMRYGLNDVCSRVRLAAVRILINLKSNRFIKAKDVVVLKMDLLPRLAIENNIEVCRCLVQLLYPSYCPESKSDDDRMQRIVDLVLSNRDAARNFHRFVFQNGLMSVADAANHMHNMIGFVALMWRHAKATPELTVDASGNDVSELELGIDNVQLAEQQTEKCDGNSVVLIRGLLECVAILWSAVRYELKADTWAVERSKLQRMSARVIPGLFSYYKDDEISESLLYIGSMLKDYREVNYLAKSVISKLEKNELNEKQQRCYLEAACAWQMEELIQRFVVWLTQTVTIINESMGKNVTEPVRKRVKFQVTAERTVDPGQCIRYLHVLLRGPTMRQRLIVEHSAQIRVLAEHIDFAAGLLQQHVDDAIRNVHTESPIALADLIDAYHIRWLFASILVLEAKDDDDSLLQWHIDQIPWIIDHFVEHLSDIRDSDIFQPILRFLQNTLQTISSSLVAGIYSDKLNSEIGRLLRHMVDKDETVPLLLSITITLTHLTDTIAFSDDCKQLVTIVCPAVQSLLRFLIHLFSHNDVESPNIEYARALQCLLTSLCLRGVDEDVRVQCCDSAMLAVVLTIFNNFLASNRTSLTIVNPNNDNDDWQCSPLCDLLLRNILAKDVDLAEAAAAQLISCIDEGIIVPNDAPIAGIGAVVQIIAVLPTKSASVRICRQMLIELLNQFNVPNGQRALFDSVTQILLE